jgi:hypothetical protein
MDIAIGIGLHDFFFYFVCMIYLFFREFLDIIGCVIETFFIRRFFVCKLVIGPIVGFHQLIERTALISALHPALVRFSELSLLGPFALGSGRKSWLINGQDGVIHHA